MSLSAEAHEDLLVSVEIIAQERLKLIARTKDHRAAIETQRDQELREVTLSHRNANRVLVDAIEEAHKRGIQKSEIYKRVGLTTQRFGQLKRQILDWNREEGRSQ